MSDTWPHSCAEFLLCSHLTYCCCQSLLRPCRPALLTVLLLLWLPETPSSLLQRGKLAEARIALQRLRGMLHNTEQEYGEILKASRLFSTVSKQCCDGRHVKNVAWR